MFNLPIELERKIMFYAHPRLPKDLKKSIHMRRYYNKGLYTFPFTLFLFEE